MNNEEIARGARDGSVTFEQFVRGTAPAWRGRAHAIARSFRLPTWMTAEDLYQELLFFAWKAVGKFDAARGCPAWSFVSFAAIKATIKVAHKARGAEQHRRKGPSRFEAPMSSLAKAGEEAGDVEIPVEDGQEEALDLRRAIARLPFQDVLRAYAGARDADAAADEIYDDCRERLRYRWQSREHARADVRGIVRSIAMEVSP